MEELTGAARFEWDGRNRDKNRTLNGVEWWEIEEVFFNDPLLVAADATLPQALPPLHALGRTRGGRHLHVVFTTHGPAIRAISGRPMKRKERSIYAQAVRNGGSPALRRR